MYVRWQWRSVEWMRNEITGFSEVSEDFVSV